MLLDQLAGEALRELLHAVQGTLFCRSTAERLRRSCCTRCRAPCSAAPPPSACSSVLHLLSYLMKRAPELRLTWEAQFLVSTLLEFCRQRQLLPVNPKFLPRVTQLDVKKFFEELCGIDVMAAKNYWSFMDNQRWHPRARIRLRTGANLEDTVATESKCQIVNEKEMGLLEIKHGLLQVAETLDFLHTRSRRVAMVILGGNLTQGPYDLIFNGKSISGDYSLKGQMNEGKSMEQSNWTVKGD
ncbi:hypothetical protein Zm00014a_022255 [Zea mays]|uniref:Uncharacterized protein n=1 Tax=Zea mays TaxID=4577 RepID=A0A3L6G3Z2_MAIZE|nr:hypothetical protein Zm00014a_022255 [Zea mays]